MATKTKAKRVEKLLADTRKAWDELQAFRRKTAGAVFKLGGILRQLKRVAKPENWKAYCDDTIGIPHATAYQAIRLHRNATKAGKGEGDLEDFSVTAAKVAFGVLRAAPTKPAPSPASNNPPPVGESTPPALSVVAAPTEGAGTQPETPAGHLQTLAAVLATLERTLAACKGTIAESDDDTARAEFDRLCGHLADLSRQYQPTKPKRAGRKAVNTNAE